jgi:hypothetical protein
METSSAKVDWAHEILLGLFVPISAELCRYAARQHPRLLAVSKLIWLQFKPEKT